MTPQERRADITRKIAEAAVRLDAEDGKTASVMPYYGIVPKEPKANLRFRKAVLDLGDNSAVAAGDLKRMCAADPLFWINTFVWTYDPRLIRTPVVPLNTYAYQDDALITLLNAMGREDVLIEKSRDMGASWITLLTILYYWQFHDSLSFLLVSRNEDLVDKSENPDALFWKLDFALQYQPKWLRPKFERTRLSLKNESNNSTIGGASTTSDTSRGGRRTAILLDEFAAVPDGHAMAAASRDTTSCRIFNSTPKGTGNAFYQLATQADIKKLRLHWSVHPVKAEGLYTAANGKVRSPWYDTQCRRAAHPVEIAQELDIDYIGSAFQFFDNDILDRIVSENCRPAYRTGILIPSPNPSEPPTFEDADGGYLRLWNVPSRDRNYVVGADISAGTGASNSVASVLDGKTGEKVGEFATAKMKPEEFARMVVLLCRLFKGFDRDGALLIWEANGLGRLFGDEVLKSGYRRIYWRQKNEGSFVETESTIPGYWTNKENKVALLGAYRKALAENLFIQHSLEAVEDARRYIYQPNGTVEFDGARQSIDPTGAGDNHGDRVMADAVAWFRFLRVDQPSESEDDPPPNCLQARIREVELAARRADEW